MVNQHGEELVPCGICGDPTPMRGTKRCDRCWQLERCMKGDPALARKIMAEIDAPVVADLLANGMRP